MMAAALDSPEKTVVVNVNRPLEMIVEHVSDRVVNPFDIRPPREAPFSPDREVVPGYGAANADFHVIGDHPGIHGGIEAGRPFGGEGGENLVDVLSSVDLFRNPPTNLFLSYIHPVVPDDDTLPTAESYQVLERFFDAEFRAINAHILLPVGPRATEYVLAEHSTYTGNVPDDIEEFHASEIRGRGFLIVPVREPRRWSHGDAEDIEARLRALLNSDYRQTKGVATLIG